MQGRRLSRRRPRVRSFSIPADLRRQDEALAMQSFSIHLRLGREPVSLSQSAQQASAGERPAIDMSLTPPRQLSWSRHRG